jgi:hypothetical protein
MKRFIGAIIIVGLASIAARVTYMKVNSLPLFNLNQVNINCPANLDRQEVIRNSHLTLGESIFKQDLRIASMRLLDLPKVEAISINRRLPSAIDIKIEAEEAVLLVKAECLYGLTRGQKLMKIDQPELILPLVTGIEGDYGSASVKSSGYYYPDQIKLFYALNIYGAIRIFSDSLGDRLSEIHFADLNNAELYFDPHGLKVVLPLRGYLQALSRLSIMDSRGLLKESGVIDMSGGRMINRTGV